MSEKNIQSKSARVVLRALASVVLALLIWVYVSDTTGEDVTKSFSGVQVVFEGEDLIRESRDLIITELDVTSLKATVSGSRRNISGLNASDIRAVIDVSDITRSGSYTLSSRLSISGNVDENSFTLIQTDPDLVHFYVDKISKKSVPVKGIFNGNAAEGFSAEPLVFEPSSITLYGPQSDLDQVEYVWVSVDRDNVDKTVSYDSPYTLMSGENEPIEDQSIEMDYESVLVTLPVVAVKEIGLTVNIIAGAGAKEADTKIRIEPDSITLSGEAEVLNGINTISLADIDLADLTDVLTETYLIKLPNDTVNVSGEKEATVSVELKGIKTKAFTVNGNNISCVNVSEGFVAELFSESIENVLIRGPETVIDDISAANIRAVADLNDYGTATGMLTVPVKITIDGAPDAGAFGSYSVYIKVSREEVEPE